MMQMDLFHKVIRVADSEIRAFHKTRIRFQKVWQTDDVTTFPPDCRRPCVHVNWYWRVRQGPSLSPAYRVCVLPFSTLASRRPKARILFENKRKLNETTLIDCSTPDKLTLW